MLAGENGLDRFTSSSNRTRFWIATSLFRQDRVKLLGYRNLTRFYSLYLIFPTKMAPVKTSQNILPITRGEMDRTMTKSKTLQSARDWMPHLTVFFSVVGFTVIVLGYYETLPPSQKPISIGGQNLTRAVKPSDSMCGDGVYFRGGCLVIDASANEAVLAIYAVYYNVFAILGCLQHDLAYKFQFNWSVIGFTLHLILGLSVGKHLLALILGWQFFLAFILFVLSVFKKGSGSWGLLSQLLGEHDEKPVEVIKSSKADKPWMVENFSGIQIV